jgi:hypothetical protein
MKYYFLKEMRKFASFLFLCLKNCGANLGYKQGITKLFYGFIATLLKYVTEINRCQNLSKFENYKNSVTYFFCICICPDTSGSTRDEFEFEFEFALEFAFEFEFALAFALEFAFAFEISLLKPFISHCHRNDFAF